MPGTLIARSIRLTAIASTLVLFIAACAPPQRDSTPMSGEAGSDRPAVKKSITAAVPGNLSTVSSFLAVSGTGTATPGSGEVGQLLNHGLTGAGLTTDREPLIAEAVPSTDNGLWKVLADGRMETTWHLRSNVLWHDGAPFSTQDLLFTARVVSDKELGVPRDRRFDSIENIQTPDAQTITVTWKQPFIEADQLFGSGQYGPMPQHLLEDTYLNRKDTLLNLPYWSREFVGTGPFVLRDWIEGSHLVLQANTQFVLGRPKIEEIEVRFIPAPETLVANVAADAIDIVLGRSLSLQQGATLREQWRDGTVYIVTGEPRSLVPQHQNPSPPIVGNVAFRKALAHAIDRQEMAGALGVGLTPPAEVGIPLDNPIYKEVSPAVVRYEFDPRKAISMIERLGYSRGQDGLIRDSANQPLGVLLRSSEREVNINVVLSAADFWKRIGVQAETEVVPLAQSTADPQKYSGFPAFQTGGGNYAALTTLNNLRPEQVPSAQNGFLGQNTGRYVSAELTNLIDRYFVTIPWAERMQVLQAIFRHITDQLVVIPLYYDSNPSLIRNRLANAYPAYFGNAYLWDLGS